MPSYDWLLTSTFYGNWLPGDARGFVSRVRDERPDDPPTPSRRRHNAPGTPCDADTPGLRRAAVEQLTGPVIRVTAEQAEVLLAQFRETAAHRGWVLLAAAVMANHIHLVVRAEGYVDATKLLADFKAYGSRALNARWGKPTNNRGSWWTWHGSTRVWQNDADTQAAVRYVATQAHPLALYVREESSDALSGDASASRATHPQDTNTPDTNTPDTNTPDTNTRAANASPLDSSLAGDAP
jgi:REP element-mobilizing transposase RayT